MKKFAILALSISILFLSIAMWMKSKTPKMHGKIIVPGLRNPVSVSRDDFGIPRIRATNKEDLFLAFGYVYTSERWLQMELTRRIVGGRLSELLGRELIPIDRLFRTLGFKRNAKKWIDANSRWIEGDPGMAAKQYMKGVNAFVKEGTLPAEFALLGIGREDYSLEEIFGMVAYMGYSFNEAIVSDALVTSLISQYGETKVSELTNEFLPSRPSAIVDDAAITNALHIGSEIQKANEIVQSLGLPPLVGSNSWVVGSNRSKSGKPILVNDPHIGYSNPSIWFEAFLDAPGYELFGHFLPMSPYPPIGFTEKHAWGITMFENDDMDLYLEKEDPKDSRRYIFKGKSLSYNFITETIRVKGAPDETIEIRETIHGPIISGLATSLQKESKPISLKWEMFSQENKPFLAFYNMGIAKNITEFEKALNDLKAPGINIVYADTSNNIAYWGTGGLYKNNFRTDRILDGSSGNFEWGERIPFSQNPQIKNPKSGIIYTANNRPGINLPYRLQGYWQADDRANRLRQLFADNRKYSIEDMRDFQLDNYFESSDDLLNPFFSMIASRENLLTKKEKEVIAILQKWDRTGNKNSAGGAVYSELRYYLARSIFMDEMGKERFELFAGNSRMYHFLKWAYLNPKNSWWDDIHTKTKEKPAEISHRALTATTSSLMGKLGTKTSNWKWGDLLQLELIHPVGRVKPFHLIYNAGPLPVSGGSEVVNNINPKLFRNDHVPQSGPSMRRIIDFGNMDKIRSINPLGQSGHRLSPHFKNQFPLYVNGGYRQFSWDSLKSPSQGGLVLVLSP